jgi:thymidylate synthase ThyX
MEVSLKFLITPERLSEKTAISHGKDKVKNLKKIMVDLDYPHLKPYQMIPIDYDIKGISRSLLHEFKTHAIGNSNIVESTRYILNRIRDDGRIYSDLYLECNSFKHNTIDIFNIINDYYVNKYNLGDNNFNFDWLYSRLKDLITIKNLKLKGKSNDYCKMYLNEMFKTNISGIMSGECLRKLLTDRLQKNVYPEFQELAKQLYNKIPEEWKEYFKVYKYKKIDSLSNFYGDDLYKKEYLV